MADNEFRFYKINEFFDNYQKWSTIKRVEGTNTLQDIKEKKQVVLTIEKNLVGTDEDKNCLMLINFTTYDSLRIRFNPGKSQTDDFTAANTRSVVQDTFEELCSALPEVLKDEANFTLHVQKETSRLIVTTISADQNNIMRVEIQFDPFKTTIYKHKDSSSYFKVLEDAVTNI